MPDRVKIALRVWAVTMAIVTVAAIVDFIVAAFSTGFHSPNPPVTYISLTVLPFIALAAPATLLSGYVSRASNGSFHAGSMILAMLPGFVAGAAIGLGLGGTFAALVCAGVIGPLAGATLGTYIKWRVSPLAAGAVAAAMGAIFTYTAMHP